MFKPGRVLFAATFAVALCAGCSRPEPLAFSPFPGATAVIVNNARGAYHPLTVRDANTIRDWSRSWIAIATGGRRTRNPVSAPAGR